jgi:SAM-dependent methyltransferase
MTDLSDQRLLDVERRELEKLLSQSKGYYFLLMGRPIDLKVNLPCCIKLFDHPLYTQLRADSTALPFADESMDVVVLVHSVEHADNALRLLNEVSRVLRHDGRLVILGYNPWRCLARKRWAKEGALGKMLSLFGIRYLLNKTHFKLLEVRRYGLALKSEASQGGLSQWLKRFIPWYSNGYLLLASKEVHTLTPIALNAHKILSLAEKPAVAPTSRVSHD